MPEISASELAPQLRRVIRDTRRTYVGAAKWMVAHHPSVLGGQSSTFVELMDDLHRGLLVKVYGTVVRADGQWSRMEKIAGAILIEHLWGERLTGAELREAAGQVLEQAETLSWQALVRPFIDYVPLRDWHSQIETSVSRLSNLVAKCDGLTTPAETDVLHRMQQEIIEALLLQPNQDPPQAITQPSQKQKSQASRQIRTEGDDKEQPQSQEQRLEQSLAELDGLIGLDNVKERVRSLANYLKLQNQRAAAGFPSMPISLHMAFVGNPGTGKTTVARIVGQILGAMGILSRGHVVEADRSRLVAQFAGQTAVKTSELVDSALDGVLFIDEAYSLIDESGDDAFGREAIQTLLKRMEDDRSRLVVILAGYSREMEQMIASNPGLSSRVGTRLEFEDYDPISLGRIFESLCKANHFELRPASRHRLSVGFARLYSKRDRHFGNGRLARNCFEESVRQLANRVANIVPLTEELLTTIEPSDVMIPSVTKGELETWVSESHALRVICPYCTKRLRIVEKLLGRKVECRNCTKRFIADWATVDYKEPSAPQ